MQQNQGLFGGLSEIIGGVGGAIGEFAQEQPLVTGALAGGLAGALAGEDIGQEALGGLAGAIQAQENKRLELQKIHIAQQKAGVQDQQFQAKLTQNESQFRRKLAAETGKKGEPKPGQFLAATFTRRLEQAEKVFTTLEQGGFDPTVGSGFIGGLIPGKMKGESRKRQEQAEINFLNAVLRRESGAVIGPSEIETGERQYFPRPGDDEKVLTQKAQNRAIVLAGLRAEAGQALDLLPTNEQIRGQVAKSRKNFPKGNDGLFQTRAVAKENRERFKRGKVDQTRVNDLKRKFGI